MSKVHIAACQFAKQTAMQKVPHKYDVVITTNSGYPLDMNLYQSEKGDVSPHQIIRNGGIMICATECSDGLPNAGKYKKILGRGNSNQIIGDDHDLNIINTINGRFKSKQKFQQTSDVYIKSDYLSKSEIRVLTWSPSTISLVSSRAW
ncbi:MAG: hypothetical protein CM1200mP3_04280 [Chloroflexota bacterium]|nr:MAG: hypothetical protein CM1200mP3_04280 [Chloroflexota bacterium]